ncbi:MAG: tripartite tricarboxylate transporter permease [Candidatus Thermoplasmatota archaeon]
MLELLLIIFFSALGVCIGLVTGLLPGLHINNISLAVLSFSTAILALLTSLINTFSESFLLLLLCGLIISIALSHSFFSAIPSTFLGVPDEETALSVLPAHRMLLDGYGYRAVVLTAIGSIGSVIICFFLLYPVKMILAAPIFLYETLRDSMVWILIAIVAIMIATEKKQIRVGKINGMSASFLGMGFAVFVFLLSGLFGAIILNLPVHSPVGFQASVLFPALSGLFGMPPLLSSLATKPTLPPQDIKPITLTYSTKRSSIFSVLTGSLSGIFVSILPGVTSAVGTVLALTIRKNTDQEQTLLTLSAVNTACAFSTVVMLFVLLRARSGVMLAVNDLIVVEPWDDVFIPEALCYLLIFLIFAGCVSFFITLYVGKIFAQNFHKIPYRFILLGSIVFLIVLVVLFTGLLGVLILITASLIGLIPLGWGVRRSHCMGVLLVPIIIYFL